eukprot:gene14063-15529_t
MEDLDELVRVLSSTSRIDVKLSGLQYIAGLTGNECGINLITKSKKVLPSLAKLSVEDNENSQFANDAAKILCNLTRNDKGCCKVLSCVEELNNDVTFVNFFDAFCNPKHNSYTELPHIGLFLSNLTTTRKARNVFFDKESGIIPRLLPYTQHRESNIRRSAAVRMLRNISFETDKHEWLLSKEIDILPHLLLPLAGPEEFIDDEMDQLPLDLQYLPSDKQRESDPKIRCMLIETLLQFCSRKLGRNYLKDNGVYLIMRELHKNEDQENVILVLEQLIQILIGDEPEEEMEDLKNVQIPTHIAEKLQEADEKNTQNLDDNK